MIESFIDQFLESGLNDAKIDEHPAFAKFLAGNPHPHLIIVAMEALALAVVMDNSVGRGKLGLNSNIVHVIFLIFVSIIYYNGFIEKYPLLSAAFIFSESGFIAASPIA
ncbi:MAG: hypothetical protein SAMD01599839_03660 [Rectinema sp.]|jgi:hypothetical protein